MSNTAVIYARFSTSEQTKGFSLERQNRLGAEFADRRGWTVERFITDAGLSAFHGANRLEGSALHEFELEARQGLHKGKVLVVENLDRLSRQGAKAAAQLIWGLNECGVDVATFHDEHVYSADSDSDMMDLFRVVILAQQAHEESSKKSKRTSASWKRRFEALGDGTLSVPLPNIPLWMDWVNDGYVLNPHRVGVLNEIYDRYIDGAGIGRIVSILNSRDEPPWTPREHAKAKNGWFYSYIYRLLTRRAVLGEYVTMDGEVLAIDYYPQAISTEKWNRAQAALAMRKGNQKNVKLIGNRNLLLKLVVCDDCGGGAGFIHGQSAQKYTRTNGEVVVYPKRSNRYLRCDRARRNLQCDNKAILRYDTVEKTVLDGMLPRLINKRSADAGAIKIREDLAELVRLRDADQTRLENLIDAVADGGSKAIVQRIALLETSIEERSKTIEALQADLDIKVSQPSAGDDLALIEALRSDLTSEDDEVRIYTRGRVNMSLRRLLQRIAIRSNGTFRIDIDDGSWWLFDENGDLLEGASAPCEPHGE